MQDAINMWYRCRYQKSFEFRDSCYSLHCHSECPEKINFFPSQMAPYPDWAIILIICIVVFITIMSIIAKVRFSKSASRIQFQLVHLSSGFILSMEASTI